MDEDQDRRKVMRIPKNFGGPYELKNNTGNILI